MGRPEKIIRVRMSRFLTLHFLTFFLSFRSSLSSFSVSSISSLTTFFSRNNSIISFEKFGRRRILFYLFVLYFFASFLIWKLIVVMKIKLIFILINFHFKINQQQNLYYNNFIYSVFLFHPFVRPFLLIVYFKFYHKLFQLLN